MERYQGIHSPDEASKVFPDASVRSINIYLAAHEINFLLNALTGTTPDDWQRAQGIKVLDLGAGSMQPNRQGKIMHEPHFCRLLAVNGATVCGIDKYAASEEDTKLYTHIITDLAELVVSGHQLSELPELSGQQFDAVHSYRFMGYDDPSPELLFELDTLGISMHKFQNELIGQSAKLLKEGGVIGFEKIYYKKQNSDFVKVNLV